MQNTSTFTNCMLYELVLAQLVLLFANVSRNLETIFQFKHVCCLMNLIR